jgi:(2Fe-2S) ferredoxin
MAKRYQLLVCDGPSCGVCLGSETLKNRAIARTQSDPALGERLTVLDLTCFGRCDDGPNMMVREVAEGEDPELEPEPEDLDGVQGLYTGVDEGKLDAILDRHVAKDEPLDGVEVYD